MNNVYIIVHMNMYIREGGINSYVQCTSAKDIEFFLRIENTAIRFSVINLLHKVQKDHKIFYWQAEYEF